MLLEKPQRIVLLIVILWVVWSSIVQRTPYIFLDNVNLLFHEAGHILFIPFGQFMTILGGSLMQLLVPISVFCSFLLKRDLDGVAFALLWFGESLINLSYYIADGQKMLLPLLGEGHDWNYLLGRLHQLPNAELIGNGTYWMGASVVIGSLMFVLFLVFFPALGIGTAHDS